MLSAVYLCHILLLQHGVCRHDWRLVTNKGCLLPSLYILLDPVGYLPINSFNSKGNRQNLFQHLWHDQIPLQISCFNTFPGKWTVWLYNKGDKEGQVRFGRHVYANPGDLKICPVFAVAGKLRSAPELSKAL